MTDSLTRRDFLAVTGLLGAATIDQRRIPPLFRSARHHADEHLGPPSSVIRGKARFQILSPTLIRMEYGQFIDAPSVAMTNRDWPAVAHTAHDVGGWVEITTSGLLLKYRLDATGFKADTLTISWKDDNGEHVWKPGDADNKNLGGTPTNDISGRIAAGQEPGPLSRNGYFLIDDSTSPIWNAKTNWPEARPEVPGSQDQYFFVYGHDYLKFFREIIQLSGPIPMVPRYILGTWVGSRAALSADEWKRVVHRFHEEEIPLDLAVIDSLSWGKFIWAGFGVDPEQMPDLKGFLTWLKERGVKATLNEHYAAITRDSDPNFDKMRIALALPPDTQSIEHDLSDQRYAKAYMDILHKPALDDGMAFWWQDGKSQVSMPGLDDNFWTRHVEYVGQERITGKRSFVFCRLGSWGSYRYGGFFTGDLTPNWSTLELLGPFNVQAGNTLLPYVANLTGGVLEVTLSPELYQRWVQFAAFSPIFWWHGLWGLRFPWEYGPAVMQNVREFLMLRYRLIPYLYTHTRLAHETGLPLSRGTYLHYPEQEQAYTFRHQYLFGQDLLVAPITHPGAGRPVVKDVYLPAGDNWHDYFTHALYEGGQVLSYECPLDRIPLFVRAGALIPMDADAASSDAPTTGPLTIDVYAGDRTNTFRLYEDDGVSLDYRTQKYAWTPLTYTPSANGDHRITIGPAEGRYAGQPEKRVYRIRLHGVTKPKQVTIGNRKLNEIRPNSAIPGWWWSSRERVLEITMPQPVAVQESVTVAVVQAGAFRDQLIVERARVYRERLRRVKDIQNLRWALHLARLFIKKEPHVLLVTNQVEQTLNDLIDNPAGAATHPPDLRQMTDAVLTALVTKPFDSTRKIPELDPESIEGTKALADKTFTPVERYRMTAELLDCRLVATVVSENPPQGYAFPVDCVTLSAHLLYDKSCITPAPVMTYELSLPETGLPGWGEVTQDVTPAEASVSYKIQVPYQLQAGTYQFKLRATATWGIHQTVLESYILWKTTPDMDPEYIPPGGLVNP